MKFHDAAYQPSHGRGGQEGCPVETWKIHPKCDEWLEEDADDKEHFCSSLHFDLNTGFDKNQFSTTHTRHTNWHHQIWRTLTVCAAVVMRAPASSLFPPVRKFDRSVGWLDQRQWTASRRWTTQTILHALEIFSTTAYNRASVNSWARLFLKHFNFKSRRMMLCTVVLEIPTSIAICRTVWWNPGAVSWLMDNSSTTLIRLTFSAVRTVRFRASCQSSPIRRFFWEDASEKSAITLCSEIQLITSSIRNLFLDEAL